MPTITLTGDEYQELLNNTKTANNDAAALRAELVKVRTEALEQGVVSGKLLCELVRHSLTVTRFAVANLPPETIRGWPTEALRKVVMGIPALPDYSIDDRDLAGELRAFADECDRWALERASRVKAE
jgi:hypothetical protein